MKIGFEIHVQLRTKSKLFCECSTRYWEVEPNRNTCPVCTGLPGSKPYPVNKEAISMALKVAKSLGMDISKSLVFLRKHYFYPDLPSGYQRTSTPLGRNGRLGRVRIKEIHIEEDPGRYEPREGIVDFNRSGVPLIEIVTEPDMSSIEEAEAFLKELHLLLNYLDVILNPSVVFRVDANISLEGGERVEIKNINSIEGVRRALQFEIARQKRLLEMGKKVERETRHWDEARGITISLREKETEEDYRYMPDPDIPPVDITSFIENNPITIPELPWQREERLMKEYGLDKSDAHTLILDKELGEYFERLVEKTNPRFAATFVADRLRGELNYRGLDFKDVREKESSITRIAIAWFREEISKPAAIELLRRLLDENIDVEQEIKKYTLREDVEMIIDDVLRREERIVRDILSGKKEAINRLVGIVMKETQGRADPKRVKEIISQRLSRWNS